MKKTDEELERELGISRTEPPTVPDDAAAKLRRMMLGNWGRKRRKLEGWPRDRRT